MKRSTHSKLSTIGVPLGVVTPNATASAPLSARIAPSRLAISVSASSQDTSTQPGSAAPRGRVRLSGTVSRRGLATISGAARPLAHSAPPVGWLFNTSTLTKRPSSTTVTAPQRERQSVQ